MKADKIRIYAQVLEQGLDFKSYIEKAGFKVIEFAESSEWAAIVLCHASL